MNQRQFFEPDLGSEPDSPFARDHEGRLVRRNYWLDMGDASVVRTLTAGIGARLTNDHKRAHLARPRPRPPGRSGLRSGNLAARRQGSIIRRQRENPWPGDPASYDRVLEPGPITGRSTSRQEIPAAGRWRLVLMPATSRSMFVTLPALGECCPPNPGEPRWRKKR